MTETAVEQAIIIANCVVNLALAFVAITGNALVLYGVWTVSYTHLTLPTTPYV